MNHADAVSAAVPLLGPEYPFHRYADYLKRRYGDTTYRVSVDAGFTCPVRESGDPCTYCDPAGSRAPYLGDAKNLEQQISGGIEFLTRRYQARRFLLYFQAFSNTHAPVDDLRRIYDHGLSCGEFCGLIVSTRPDCVDEERAVLLESYRERDLDVWIELGLQSRSDRTLTRIKRGHTAAQFAEAVEICRDHNLLTAAHVMLGLPGESMVEAIATTRFLNGLGVDAVKFHNLVVVEGTPLYREYESGAIEVPGASDYLELLIPALEHLDPRTIVMRLTCDPPPHAKSYPEDRPVKTRFVPTLRSAMHERGTYQGRVLDTESV